VKLSRSRVSTTRSNKHVELDAGSSRSFTIRRNQNEVSSSTVSDTFSKTGRPGKRSKGACVIALVPLSQVSAKSKALEGLSMETSRWVVLDADLNLLEQNVIYANAQEGERIATDLAQRYIGN
jgi:hypothetical protein